jgi:hypothetical protein
MARNITLKIKNAKKIFGSNTQKMRREDLMQFNILNLKIEDSREYYVKQTGNNVTFIPFDD